MTFLDHCAKTSARELAMSLVQNVQVSFAIEATIQLASFAQRLERAMQTQKQNRRSALALSFEGEAGPVLHSESTELFESWAYFGSC